MAASRYKTLNEVEIAELLNDEDIKNTQKAKKIKISSIFKFRVLELKFTLYSGEIIVFCEL